VIVRRGGAVFTVAVAILLLHDALTVWVHGPILSEASVRTMLRAADYGTP
jgi:hypothetical protein